MKFTQPQIVTRTRDRVSPTPDNFRFIEWQQIYENETFEYFNGNESFEDMQPRLQERCQAVLDLGPPA